MKVWCCVQFDVWHFWPWWTSLFGHVAWSLTYLSFKKLYIELVFSCTQDRCLLIIYIGMIDWIHVQHGKTCMNAHRPITRLKVFVQFQDVSSLNQTSGWSHGWLCRGWCSRHSCGWLSLQAFERLRDANVGLWHLSIWARCCEGSSLGSHQGGLQAPRPGACLWEREGGRWILKRSLWVEDGDQRRPLPGWKAVEFGPRGWHSATSLSKVLRWPGCGVPGFVPDSLPRGCEPHRPR